MKMNIEFPHIGLVGCLITLLSFNLPLCAAEKCEYCRRDDDTQFLYVLSYQISNDWSDYFEKENASKSLLPILREKGYRRDAVRALGEIGNVNVVPAILSSLSDSIEDSEKSGPVDVNILAERESFQISAVVAIERLLKCEFLDEVKTFSNTEMDGMLRTQARNEVRTFTQEALSIVNSYNSREH